jgi:hypothetical protein
MTKSATALALAAALLTAGPAAAAKPAKYKGKTKEGTKVSFVLKAGHLDGFKSSVPTSCVSAQGGPPTATITPWAPPYKYRLGKTYKFEVKNPYPTTTYTISSRKSGKKKITGKLKLSFSRLAMNTWGDYRILTCYGTASFTARTR